MFVRRTSWNLRFYLSRSWAVCALSMLSLCWCIFLNVLPRNTESAFFFLECHLRKRGPSHKERRRWGWGNHGIMPVVWGTWKLRTSKLRWVLGLPDSSPKKMRLVEARWKLPNDKRFCSFIKVTRSRSFRIFFKGEIHQFQASSRLVIYICHWLWFKNPPDCVVNDGWVELKDEWYSLLACYPRTGRTHQIRAHLQFKGLPQNDAKMTWKHVWSEKSLPKLSICFQSYLSINLFILTSLCRFCSVYHSGLCIPFFHMKIVLFPKV